VLTCAPALAKGRDELSGTDSLPPSTEDSLLGGIFSRASHAVLTGGNEKLPELLPDLVDFALSPYLGSERAAAMAQPSLIFGK
jgi:hypothetical protein